MLTARNIGAVLRHVERFRRHAALALLALMGVACAFYVHADVVLRFLSAPLGSLTLHYFSPFEGWVVRVKVALVCAVLVLAPVVLFAVLSTLRTAWPPLRSPWRRLGFVAAVEMLFWTGLAFGWKLVLPACVRFFAEAGEGFLEPLLSGDSYVTFVLILSALCGLSFELPLVIFLLTHAGWLSAEALRRGRKGALLGIFVAVAVLTPTPDAATLLLVSLPLIALYEIGVLLAVMCERRRRVS